MDHNRQTYQNFELFRLGRGSEYLMTWSIICFEFNLNNQSAVTHYIDDDSQLGLDEEDDFKGFRAISFTWTPPSDVKHVKFM